MNRDEAQVIAERLLDEQVRPELDDGEVVVLDLDHTVESDELWVFVYNTPEFVQSRDLTQALIGNSPIMVNKATGDAEFGRTDISIEEQVHGRGPDQPESIWQDASDVFGDADDDGDSEAQG